MGWSEPEYESSSDSDADAADNQCHPLCQCRKCTTTQKVSRKCTTTQKVRCRMFAWGYKEE